MPRLELPWVDEVPPEDPLEQILPGCRCEKLRGGAAPRAVHAHPVPLLCLLAFQNLCHLDISGTSGQGKPCWGRAASIVPVTAGTGTRLLVVPPPSSHGRVFLSSSNPGMFAASRLLRPPGTPSAARARVRVKKRLLSGDLRAPPQGDKTVRGGDLGEVRQRQSCPRRGVRAGAG